MSAPPAIDICPLSAATRPLSTVAPSNTIDPVQLKALISQALQLYRSSSTWPASKTFNLEHDSKVIATKGLSAQSGRLKDTAWHARRSEHSPTQSHKLNYQDFYEGLAVDHPIKERQYVEDIIRYEEVGPNIQIPSLESEPCSKYIDVKALRANVWTTEYKLPMVVSDRDFVELFLTVEFKPHSDPLSSSHIDQMLATLKEGAGNADESSEESSSSSLLRRSCLNIQLPVETPECGEKPKFVRAYYGSVEVLKELEAQGTEWWMAVQSDSSGKVPLMFQEMSMPSKVAPDVPLFIGWAVKQKQSTSN